MASLKELKGRINSVKSTQKITKAMKMVAAAKLRRAQEAAVAGRPYAERLEGVMASLASRIGGEGASPLLAGTLGGLLATWVTFVPCFLFIFLGAPYMERLRSNRALSAALTAVTASVVGVIIPLV